MSEISLFIEALIMGLEISAPVGPVGMVCMRITLAHGMKSGIASGLGAATADGVYAGLAGFGLTAFSMILVGGESYLRLAGCIYLKNK